LGLKRVHCYRLKISCRGIDWAYLAVLEVGIRFRYELLSAFVRRLKALLSALQQRHGFECLFDFCLLFLLLLGNYLLLLAENRIKNFRLDHSSFKRIESAIWFEAM
jgi:hypothetical protein